MTLAAGSGAGLLTLSCHWLSTDPSVWLHTDAPCLLTVSQSDRRPLWRHTDRLRAVRLFPRGLGLMS